tara:strand:+ start:909 stop:2186 length:1278 start_codon:yes stop_codon:yes gene_type:complete
MSRVITFTDALLIDPESLDEALGSLTITDGLISRINGPTKGKVINCQKACLAPGIIDIGVHICEPGERHKESFRSASQAAAFGGITSIITFPNTVPVIDNPELLEFFVNRSIEASQVRVLPAAAITRNCDGEEISELGFLQDKGAIAFTNGLRTIKDSKILLKALSYASTLELPYIGHCQDYFLSEGSSATAGKLATQLGLPSVPIEAEKICLERDSALADVSGIHYHASQITSELALKTLKNLKSKGRKISAGTSIHHLIFDENDISNYRTFFKLTPPLRSFSDKKVLLETISDDTIDTISSFHLPQDEESKRLPYERAASGAIGLQSLLPGGLKLVKEGYLNLPQLFRKIALNPSKLVNSKSGKLSEGSPADLVLFNPDPPFVLDRFSLLSKSKNTPFDEYELFGKVLRTFVNGNEVYNCAHQ